MGHLTAPPTAEAAIAAVTKARDALNLRNA
jgi:hypothetical protein